jgi:hypothetical protein
LQHIVALQPVEVADPAPPVDKVNVLLRIAQRRSFAFGDGAQLPRSAACAAGCRSDAGCADGGGADWGTPPSTDGGV